MHLHKPVLHATHMLNIRTAVLVGLERYIADTGGYLTQELKEQDIVIEKLPYNVIIFICNTIRKAIVSLKNNVT